MMASVRLILRAVLTFAWILCIFFPLFITWQLRLNRINSKVMQFSFYVGALIWGVRVSIRGTPSPKRPFLLVSNHFSYLDVFALGSVLPARFITKSEIASWPVIGFICRLGGCIFIDRRPSRTLHNVSEVGQIVKENAVITLFPEGSTNDGTKLLPFRSSFLSIAEEFDITVQPVTVLYTRLNGKPLDASALPIVGWYGDAYFFPHAVKFLSQNYVDVTLIFHEPVSGHTFESRKQLAQYCHDVIEKSLMLQHTL